MMTHTAKRFAAAAFLLGIVLLGAYLRFSGLSTKLFWGDEAATALRVSGQTQAQLDTLSDGVARPLDALAVYQRVHTAPPIATANSLAVDEPQHPPLFFLAERFWAGAFGSSPAALRALSALAGLLGLPAMFWLCMELFGRRVYAYTGTALIAVSPFFVTYAHEAREYAAWGTVTLLATAVLLATRRSRWWWLAYAASTAAGLYLDMLYVWVVAAHAIIVLSAFQKRTRFFNGFCAAVAGALIAYMPWIVAFVEHRAVVSQGLSWGSARMSPLLYVAKLAFAASTTFFDLTFLSIAWVPIAALICILILIAFAVTARCASAVSRVTIVALSFTPLIAFLLEDAFTHSYYATGARYHVPVWVASELAMTFMLVQWAKRAAIPARATFAAILVLGCVCSLEGNSSKIWWDNHDDADVPGIVRAIDRAERPIVISEHVRLTKLLVLSHALKPETRFVLFWKPGEPIEGISAKEPAAFALAPSKAFLDRLSAAGCRMTLIDTTSTATATADGLHERLLREQGRKDAGLWSIEPCALLPNLALPAPTSARFH
jgi:uncharacterized membrane protein